MQEGVTEVWPISAEDAHLEHPGIRRAVTLLRSGELVAFPTETVYALGGLARLPEALARIYAAKGRPQGKPLSLLILDRGMAEAFVLFTPQAERLWEAFAPGPLTLILPVRPGVRLAAVHGLRGAAVRSPDHLVARVLLRAVGEPIAAPSANRSARPSPTRAEDVLRDFAGSVPLLLDGGETSLGFESTIVDLSGDVPRLVREGAVSAEAVAEVLGHPLLPPDATALPSEGREGTTSSLLHLRVPLLVWEAAPPAEEDSFAALLLRGIARLLRAGVLPHHGREEGSPLRLAVLVPEGYGVPRPGSFPHLLVPFALPRGASGMRQFYPVLRALEAAEITAAFAFLPPGEVLRPLRERLLAAASEVCDGSPEEPQEGGGGS